MKFITEDFFSKCTNNTTVNGKNLNRKYLQQLLEIPSTKAWAERSRTYN